MMKNSAFQDFNEPAQETLDFARCQRPDGSFYGTSGQCRKGAPAGAKEKEAASAKGGGGGGTKQLRKDMIAARDAEKTAKETRQKADRRVVDAKADVSSAKSDLARKDLTSMERAKATTMKGQAERDLKKQTAAAAEARRAHIESKTEMKAAAQRFKDGQASSGDVRRFGRQDERDKASVKELKDAAASGKLSPTKQRAVERDIRMRATREKMSATQEARQSKDPVVQGRVIKNDIKKLSKEYERLRGKPEAGARRSAIIKEVSSLVKKQGDLLKKQGPTKAPDTSPAANQRRANAAARARD